MNYLVSVNYDPGTPKVYAVENAKDVYEARAKVLAIIGYDPGVPVEVTQIPVHLNQPHRFSNLGRCTD